MKKQTAFTLTELIVAIMIAAVLALMAIPRYRVAMEKSISMEGVHMVEAMRAAEDVYKLEYGNYTSNPGLLEIAYDVNSNNFLAPELLPGGPGFPTNTLASVRRIDIGYRIIILANGNVYCQSADCSDPFAYLNVPDVEDLFVSTAHACSEDWVTAAGICRKMGYTDVP